MRDEPLHDDPSDTLNTRLSRAVKKTQRLREKGYEVDGFIKCKILPPQDLHQPVLPTKTNNKLMFILCRTCGMSMNQEACIHTANERALVETWVVEEVNEALEMGYVMMEVYEIWQYDIEQYDKAAKTGGLFTQMMYKFLKMKQQASSCPSSCTTQKQRNAYIKDFFNKEGIKMEFEEILKNPGLRSLAKLMLNSFWGKFGQRENQPKTDIVRQPHKLGELLSNPAIEINDIYEINDETMVVIWEYREEASDLLTTIKSITGIAAYTTRQARLVHCSYLEMLGDRVLYYDTDSIIYISRPV